MFAVARAGHYENSKSSAWTSQVMSCACVPAPEMLFSMKFLPEAEHVGLPVPGLGAP